MQDGNRDVSVRLNAWTELDYGILRENLDVMSSALAGRSECILVVKANAYGHGMEAVARHAFEAGVRRFMVARMDEALALRPFLPAAQILLLGAVWPEHADVLMERRIVPVLVSEQQAGALGAEARRRGMELPCHVKIDTGMGRFGIPWEDAVPTLLRLKEAGGLMIQGICSHFASAGRPADRQTEIQADRFRRVAQDCEAAGMSGLFRHIANSVAFLLHPEWDMDGVRLGILAYGYSGKYPGLRVRTKPCLQWKTRVISVKKVPAGVSVGYLGTYTTVEPTCLAIIDVGYSDGFPRLMSNKGVVLIRGRRMRVVGRVSMNFSTVDAGLGTDVREGDEVVLIGQQGLETLWADELARWCQTIPYEILTNIRSHAPV